RGGGVMLLFPLRVAALAGADRGPAMLLSTPALVHGGRLSYALYLVHIPLFEVYWLALERFPVLAPNTALAHVVGIQVLFAAVGVSALVYRMDEEPSRRGRRGLAPAVGRLGVRGASAQGDRRARPGAVPG